MQNSTPGTQVQDINDLKPFDAHVIIYNDQQQKLKS